MKTITTYTEEEILNRVFDAIEKKLCFTTPNIQRSPVQLTIQEIFNLAFDNVNNTLRIK